MSHGPTEEERTASAGRGSGKPSDAPVLVVDDIPMFRELMANFLSATARVITAGDGDEAFELARRERPRLIISDLEMPGCDGEALCRSIRKDPELADTHFLMILPGDEARDRVRAIRAGADDVLPKPLQRVELVGSVSRFLTDNKVRGLPRVAVNTPVTLFLSEDESRARTLNVSRGGMFLRTELSLPTHSEWRMRFHLPETEGQLTPTAMVVWRSESQSAMGAGFGMRFVELDGQAARTLEDFVYERTPVSHGPPVPI